MVSDTLRLEEMWNVLLTAISSKSAIDPTKRYCAVRSIRGSKFQPGDMAIIGRAPNGWVSTFSRNDVDDSALRLALIHRILNEPVCPVDKTTVPTIECKPMHWIHHPYVYKGKPAVNTQVGRFWSTMADIVKHQLRDGRADEWEESIAWTNLYPVSEESGNPPDLLKEAQLKASAEMLRSELETWKPGVALFVTEVNHKDGSRTLDSSKPFHDVLGMTDFCFIKGPSIVATARLADLNTRLIFTVRPDARHGSGDYKGDINRELDLL